MKRRKPGPKAKLRHPEMIRFALPSADRRTLDAYAQRHGITRSEALRRAVTLLNVSGNNSPS